MKILTYILLFMCIQNFAQAATSSDNTWKLKYPDVGGVIPYVITPVVDAIMDGGQAHPVIERELTDDERSSFGDAIDHYHLYTPIRFVNVRKLPGRATEGAPWDPIFVKPSGEAGSKAHWGPSKQYAGFYDRQSSLEVGNNAGSHTLVHELMHSLGFFHEQQRPDRDAYIYVDQVGLSSEQKSDNYTNGQHNLAPQKVSMGSFDYDSIMLYENDRISFKIPPEDLLDWVVDNATPSGKYIRIKLVDSTPDDLIDNPALHNESGMSNPDVYGVARGWHSAQWSIENIVGNRFFHLRNRASGKYLYAVSASVVENKSSFSASDQKGQWEIAAGAGGGSYLVNRQYGTYLTKSIANVAVLAGTPSSTAASWVFEPMVLEDRLQLSLKDLLAINIAYGFPVSITLDNNPGNLKIHTIGQSVSGGVPETEAISQATGSFLPDGAQWMVRKVGSNSEPFVAIQNQETGYYLNSGSGSSVSSASVSNIENTPSAHWLFEVTEGAFRIKSRTTSQYLYSSGPSLVQSPVALSIDSNWIVNHEVKHIFHSNFMFSYAEGKPFQMILASSSSGTTVGAYMSGSALRVGELSSSPTATNTQRSRWFFEPVSLQSTKYFRIRNASTGLYLHREYGSLSAASEISVNPGMVGLKQWHSAQWSFEVEESGFYIKNRNSGEYLSASGTWFALAGSPTALNALWSFVPNNTVNDSFIKQISFDLNVYEKWVPLAERENAFQVLHYLAGQPSTDIDVLAFEGGVLNLQKLVGTTNQAKLKASSWQFLNNAYSAYSIKHAFGNDVYALGHFSNGLSAKHTTGTQFPDGMSAWDPSANWVIEVYQDYFRIKNLKTNQYLVNSGGTLALSLTPTTLTGNWRFQALNPLP